MSLLALVLAAGAVAGPGSGLVALAFPGPARGAERAFRATLALALGLGAWSTAFALVVFAAGRSDAGAVAKDALLVALGVALHLRARALAGKQDTPPPTDGPAGAPEPVVGGAGARAEKQDALLPRLLAIAVCAAGALAVMLFLLQHLALPEGHWDACAIWNNRARFLFLGEGRTFARPFLAENARTDYAHADYPLLLPGCVAEAWRVLGDTPHAIGLVAAAFTALSVLGLGLGVARRRGRDAGLAAAVVLLGAPFYVSVVGAGQLADVPLAAFVVLALALVAAAFEEEERRGERLAVAGLAVGFAAWTKNEGQLFLVVFLAALALVRAAPGEPRREGLRRAATFALGAAPPLLALAWFKLAYAPANDIVGGLGGAAERIGDGARWVTIARAGYEQLHHVHRWGAGLLASPLVALAFAGVRARGPAVRLGALVVGGVVAGFFLVYLVTPLDLAWHLEHSLERLVAQLLPAWLLVVFLTLPEEKC